MLSKTKAFSNKCLRKTWTKHVTFISNTYIYINQLKKITHQQSQVYAVSQKTGHAYYAS